MSLRVDDLVVLASLGFAAWAFYSLGFRARSLPVGIALLALPTLVWLGCRIWVYRLVDEAGVPQLLGALPAVASYLGVVWIAYRQIGGLTYRVGPPPIRFGRVLQRADEAMQRAYAEKPATTANDQIPVEPLRKRLESALAEFRALDSPPGAWRRLVDQRVHLHEAYIAVLTSPSPVGPEAIEPLERLSREWMREVQELVATEERTRAPNATE